MAEGEEGETVIVYHAKRKEKKAKLHLSQITKWGEDETRE